MNSNNISNMKIIQQYYNTNIEAPVSKTSASRSRERVRERTNESADCATNYKIVPVQQLTSSQIREVNLMYA